MNLFPIVQPQAAEKPGAEGLYAEIAWDYESNTPIYRNGSPVFVSGSDAVLVWAWNAMQTPRFVHEIFTWDYGNEIEGMIGKPFTDELKKAEVPRLVREGLMINPYITGVKNITVAMDGDHLEISCRIETVYGEVALNV
jgi:hypothetical protein